MPLPAHCPDCGAPVAADRPSAGHCTGCGRPVYANARPAAGVFLVRGDAVLLVRRAAPPRVGAWDIPGGFLDETEPPEVGAAREVAEELGWTLDPAALRLALVSLNPWPEGAVLDILYEADAPEGDPQVGDDAGEARWFSIDDLPEDIAFDSSRTALLRWREARRRQERRRQERRRTG